MSFSPDLKRDSMTFHSRFTDYKVRTPLLPETNGPPKLVDCQTVALNTTLKTGTPNSKQRPPLTSNFYSHTEDRLGPLISNWCVVTH